jgi:hypothetical protein
MRKRTLLIATAIAALTVGSSTAFAQSPPGDARNPASKNAPAEKVAPSPGAGAHSAPANRMGQAPAAPAAQPNRMGQTSQPTHRETTGQAPSEQRAAPNKDNERATTPNRSNERAATPHRSDERAGRPNRDTTGQGTGTMENNRSGAGENRAGAAPGPSRAGTRAAVNLTSDQKTKIHGIIIGQRSAPRVAHVDFDVKVGVAVPRTVVLAPIPETIVTIEPAWRGFEYFLVGDEIVVVDPATLEIVAVLPA